MEFVSWNIVRIKLGQIWAFIIFFFEEEESAF